MRATLIAMTLPAAAFAETVCRFDTECVETDPCAETNYELRIDEDGELTDDTGSVLTSPLPGALETIVASGPGDGAYAGAFGAMFLTTETATARLTVHFTEGPMAITYHGTCVAAS